MTTPTVTHPPPAVHDGSSYGYSRYSRRKTQIRPDVKYKQLPPADPRPPTASQRASSPEYDFCGSDDTLRNFADMYDPWTVDSDPQRPQEAHRWLCEFTAKLVVDVN